MRKDADFTGKIKSAVAGGGRNRYNKDSVFLSLDIEETTGGQYADNRNGQHFMQDYHWMTAMWARA